MLNARNIHFAVLGMILGAAAAYVYASYQTESGRQAGAQAAMAALGGSPAGHPEVTNEEVLALFDEALASNPNDPELLTRYASYLFDLGRYGEAADLFARVLETTPADADVRTFMATSLYAAGRRAEAMDEFNRALERDPTHILALHNLALGHIDFTGDLDAAEDAMRRIEAVEPNYVGLGSLRARVAAARSTAGPR